MTLPVLTAAVCRAGKSVSRDGVWLYGAYTLGGALGVAVVAGVVLHRLGAAGSLLLMIGTNAVVGAVCFLRDRALRLSAERAAHDPAPNTGRRGPSAPGNY